MKPPAQRVPALMAPELVQLPSAEVDALAVAVPSDSGPRRWWRAIERSAQILVELRHAPDPRVLVEVALVQLTRPAADAAGRADVEALAARVAKLEQALAGGAPRRRRHGGARSTRRPGGPSSAAGPSEPSPRRPRPAAAGAGRDRAGRAAERHAPAAVEPATAPPTPTPRRRRHRRRPPSGRRRARSGSRSCARRCAAWRGRCSLRVELVGARRGRRTGHARRRPNAAHQAKCREHVAGTCEQAWKRGHRAHGHDRLERRRRPPTPTSPGPTDGPAAAAGRRPETGRRCPSRRPYDDSTSSTRPGRRSSAAESVLDARRRGVPGRARRRRRAGRS